MLKEAAVFTFECFCWLVWIVTGYLLLSHLLAFLLLTSV